MANFIFFEIRCNNGDKNFIFLRIEFFWGKNINTYQERFSEHSEHFETNSAEKEWKISWKIVIYGFGFQILNRESIMDVLASGKVAFGFVRNNTGFPCRQQLFLIFNGGHP